MPSLIEQAKDLREKRAKLFADARALSEKAEKENRDFSTEEKTQYDAILGDADKLKSRYERLESEARMAGELEQSQHAPIHTGQQEQPQENRQQQANGSFERRFSAWLTRDYRGLDQAEYRALQAELDTAGGYLRPPQEFINQLIKNIDDSVYIRQWATKFTVTAAESMGVPTLENDPADADWTSELATGSEDSTMSFGKRELRPYPLAKRIKISKKLLRSVPSVETLVRNRLAYKFAITHEKAFLTGSGAGQPLGVFTASTNGISTSRDVSSGNTSTSIQFDGLINAKYSIKQAYWPRLRWLFHRDGQKQIAKLKDNEGLYLWRENVRVGEPDTVLGVPAFMSEYAPSTFTTGLYVGIIGDFSNYWIVDALTLEFQMLMELYAETNQVGLIGRMETDAQPTLEEAFARVKLA